MVTEKEVINISTLLKMYGGGNGNFIDINFYCCPYGRAETLFSNVQALNLYVKGGLNNFTPLGVTAADHLIHKFDLAQVLHRMTILTE